MTDGPAVTTTLDCELLRDLYGTDEVRRLVSTDALLQAWLDVEAALAEAQAEVGVIPAAAAERIRAEARAELFDVAELRAAIAETKHPLVPLVRALAERCGDAGGWVHWGATTQDIVDTALVLVARAALAPIARDLDRAALAAAALAARHATSPMAGRTHYQHAVPITFGLKAATWADELDRARARLATAIGQAAVAQLSGAAGTLATLGGDAAAVQAAFARRLELRSADVHWHATRDRLRDLGHALAEVGSAGERIASEVIRLQSTEVAEVAEPAGEAHVGSSTMPQKRNPMDCEYLVATSRLLRAAVGAVADAPAHAYERDMGYWAIEWLAFPQALILAGGATARLATLLEGLQVDEARMAANLDLTEGQIMAEAVMMALGAEVGHESAHELVRAAARQAQATGRTLAELLREDPRVTQHLAPERLESLLDPATYLGLAPSSASAVAARVAGLQRHGDTLGSSAGERPGATATQAAPGETKVDH